MERGHPERAAGNFQGDSPVKLSGLRPLADRMSALTEHP
jgi:hypothetical protein